MANNRFGVDIVANDGSGKGFDSLQKRAEKYEAAAEKRAKAAAKSAEDRRKAAGAGASGRGFSAAESAFGGGGVSGAVAGKLSAIGEATKNLKSAFTAASHEGAGLSEKLGAVAATGATAAGVVTGLAIAGFKLATAWTEGGAALGRLSAGIGVSTDLLQRWQGAGERFGVDKDAMGGALGGIGGSIHEAVYGRNNTALAALNQLGVKIRRGANGQVDVDAMASQLADATARQKDPYTQARIASIFGFSGALPAFRQGSGALKANGADFARYGAMMSDRDVADATRLYGKGVTAKQGLQRQLMGVQGAAARAGEGLLDAGLAHDRGVADARPGAVAQAFGSAAHTIVTGASSFGHHVERFGGMVAGAAAGLGASLAARIERLGERSRQDQVSPKGARGVMQLMPGTARQVARRLGRPLDEARYRNDPAYSRMLGGAYLDEQLATFGGDEMLATAAYNAGPGAVTKWIRRYGDPRKGQISDADFARHIPYKETRDYVGRVVPGTLQHRHTVELKGFPAGSRVTSRTDGQSGVAVGYAMTGDGP